MQSITQVLFRAALPVAALLAGCAQVTTAPIKSKKANWWDLEVPTLGQRPATHQCEPSSTMVIPATRRGGHRAEWAAYTPCPPENPPANYKPKPRLPAWFVCQVTVTQRDGRYEFDLYDVSAQGKRLPVLVRFHDPNIRVYFNGSNTPVPEDPEFPGKGFYRIRPMKWSEPDANDPDDHYGYGDKNYVVKANGATCVLDAIYAKPADYFIFQPGDGSPPPPSSGHEH